MLFLGGVKPYASAKLTGSRKITLSFAFFILQTPDKIHHPNYQDLLPRAVVGSPGHTKMKMSLTYKISGRVNDRMEPFCLAAETQASQLESQEKLLKYLNSLCLC